MPRVNDLSVADPTDYIAHVLAVVEEGGPGGSEAVKLVERSTLPEVYHPGDYGDDVAAAARAAFDDDMPLLITTPGVYEMDIDPATECLALTGGSTAEDMHEWLQTLIRWRKRCIFGTGVELWLNVTEDGVHFASAWDALGDGNKILGWRGGLAGELLFKANSVTYKTPSALALGARGANDTDCPTIFCGANDYILTLEFATAVPSYVDEGYTIGLRNFQGLADVETLSGALVVAYKSVDGLTVKGRITNARNADLSLSGYSIITTTAYGQVGCQCVFPSACFALDTKYTVDASKSITGITTYAAKTITAITNANPGVLTSAAHGFSNGDLIAIADVGGMDEVNGVPIVVTNATTDTFELYEYTIDPDTGAVSSAALDTSTFGTYTSGGTATRAARITVTSHGYSANARIRLASIGGMTELNGRQIIVGTPAANDFAILDGDRQPLDTSAFGSYTSGGTATKVTEVWTGGSDDEEGYRTFLHGGRGRDKQISWSWVGQTGRAYSQDQVHVLNTAAFFYAGLDGCYGGAGDKIFRAYGAGAQIYVRDICGGAGGAQEVVAPQGGADAQVAESSLGNVARNVILVGDNSEITMVQNLICGGTYGIYVSDAGRLNIDNTRISGSRNGLYLLGDVMASSTVLIDLCTYGLSGYAGKIVGQPQYGTGAKANTTDSQIIADGVGGTTSNRGGIRHVANISANQAEPIAFMPRTVDNGTGTESANAVTVNFPMGRITTSSLSTAAGATYTITVTCSHCTSASNVFLTRNGGSNTAGVPLLEVTTISDGSFVITVRNAHASAALNGTLVIAFEVVKRG